MTKILKILKPLLVLGICLHAKQGIAASVSEAKRLFEFAELNYSLMFDGRFGDKQSVVATDKYGRTVKYYFNSFTFILVGGGDNDLVSVGGQGFENGKINVGNIYNFIDKPQEQTPEQKISSLAGTWKVKLNNVFSSFSDNNYEITIYDRTEECSRNCITSGMDRENELIATYFIPEDEFIIVNINLGWSQNVVISYLFKNIVGNVITGTVKPSGKSFTATRVK